MVPCTILLQLLVVTNTWSSLAVGAHNLSSCSHGCLHACSWHHCPELLLRLCAGPSILRSCLVSIPVWNLVELTDKHLPCNLRGSGHSSQAAAH